MSIDTLRYIFELLDGSSKASASSVCKEWNSCVFHRNRRGLLALEALKDGNLNLFYLAREAKQPLMSEMYVPCMKYGFDSVLDLLEERDIPCPDDIGNACCKYDKEDLYLRYKAEEVWPEYYTRCSWIGKYYGPCVTDCTKIAIYKNDLETFERLLPMCRFRSGLLRLIRDKPCFLECFMRLCGKTLDIHTLIDFQLIETVPPEYLIYYYVKNCIGDDYHHLRDCLLDARSLEAVIETNNLEFIRFIFDTHPDTTELMNVLSVDWEKLSLPIIKYLYKKDPTFFTTISWHHWYAVTDLKMTSWLLKKNIIDEPLFRSMFMLICPKQFTTTFGSELTHEDFDTACQYGLIDLAVELLPKAERYLEYPYHLTLRIGKLLFNHELLPENPASKLSEAYGCNIQELDEWLHY